MSWSPCPDPTPGVPTTVNAIETLIVPRAVDLGEMEVRRALPSTKRQMPSYRCGSLMQLECFRRRL